MPRFVLLEHTGAPDDPHGCHYDLLLENGDTCQTWRLGYLPVVGAAPQVVMPLPPHHLAWLDRTTAKVSGDRGYVRRVLAGQFNTSLPISTGCHLRLPLSGPDLNGILTIDGNRLQILPST